MKIFIRLFRVVVAFQFWTKRSRGSRLSVLVIFEREHGEVRPLRERPVGASAAPVERSAVGREPDGGERGGTLPIFKEKKSLEREEAKGWEE